MTTSNLSLPSSVPDDERIRSTITPQSLSRRHSTAIVYCEANFGEIEATVVEAFENEFNFPATDALKRPSNHLVDMAICAFPALAENLLSRTG